MLLLIPCLVAYIMGPSQRKNDELKGLMLPTMSTAIGIGRPVKTISVVESVASSSQSSKTRKEDKKQLGVFGKRGAPEQVEPAEKPVERVRKTGKNSIYRELEEESAIERTVEQLRNRPIVTLVAPALQ